METREYEVSTKCSVWEHVVTYLPPGYHAEGHVHILERIIDTGPIETRDLPERRQLGQRYSRGKRTHCAIRVTVVPRLG